MVPQRVNPTSTALVAAGLLAAAGVVDLVLGLAAIAGAERLETNVREIETAEGIGELYFSLGAWGVILTALGLGALAAGWRLLFGGPHARLAALIAAYFALAGAFFGLAIFRWPAVAIIVLLLAALYVLTYRLRGPEGE